MLEPAPAIPTIINASNRMRATIIATSMIDLCRHTTGCIADKPISTGANSGKSGNVAFGADQPLAALNASLASFASCVTRFQSPAAMASAGTSQEPPTQMTCGRAR